MGGIDSKMGRTGGFFVALCGAAAVSVALSGCASLPESGSPAIAAECPDCAAGTGKAEAGGDLAPGDRALLRASRAVFDDALRGSGTAEFSGQSPAALRVYRWGRNENTPLGEYAWDADAGERWHVVRESAPGCERESCGRDGVRPIDGFYAADAVTATSVRVSIPGARPIYGSPKAL